jgi:hypothetical protein
MLVSTKQLGKIFETHHNFKFTQEKNFDYNLYCLKDIINLSVRSFMFLEEYNICFFVGFENHQFIGCSQAVLSKQYTTIYANIQVYTNELLEISLLLKA